MQDDTLTAARAGSAAPRVVLHLGAHKTASTHFNKLLRKNSALLDKHSVAVPKKDDVRRLITRRIFGQQVGDGESPAQVLAELSGGARTVFISDENILGTPRGLVQRGMMYPSAASNLRNTVTLLGDAPVEIWLAVREPGGFVTSSWGEAMRAHGYLDFSAYVGADPMPSLRWTQLLRRLRAACPDLPLTIWSFEQYRAQAPALLANLLGVDHVAEEELRPIESIVRPGLSQRAVEEIRTLCAGGDAKPPQDRFEEIVKAYPKSGDYPAPSPWTAQQGAALRAQYDQDLSRLAALDGVRFLG